MKKSIKLTAVAAVAALTLGAGATAFAKDIQGGPQGGPQGGMHKGGPMGGPMGGPGDHDGDGDFGMGMGPRGPIDGVAAVLADLVKQEQLPRHNPMQFQRRSSMHQQQQKQQLRQKRQLMRS